MPAERKTVIITGATGFVGRAMTAALQGLGHHVIAFVRDETRARATLGAEVELLDVGTDDETLTRTLEKAHAVVNLAGAPIAARWTDARRRAIVSSRVDLTRRLVRAMRAAGRRPDVLVSTSAVGIYGEDRRDEVLDAHSPVGEGFAAGVCRDWEAAAREAETLGVRVALMRVGLVLGREGGILGAVRPVFAAGLGGRLGSGEQFMPWIHLDDLVRLYLRALDEASFRGVFEAVGPSPVTNRDFTTTLARALGRRAGAPVPRLALRLALGEASSLMLASHRVMPRRTIEHGFEFQFPTLTAALADLLDDHGVEIQRCDPASVPDDPYLRARPPRYVLEQRTVIARPRTSVSPFFERPENLGPLTPPAMEFEIRGTPPAPLRAGARIDYRIRLGPFPMSWRTEIRQHGPGGFVDAQLRGPYRSWFHEHRFEADGARTLMLDRVYYAPPLGVLGALANRLFVGPTLTRIFAYRASVIRRRFGAPIDVVAGDRADDRAA